MLILSTKISVIPLPKEGDKLEIYHKPFYINLIGGDWINYSESLKSAVGCTGYGV